MNQQTEHKKSVCYTLMADESHVLIDYLKRENLLPQLSCDESLTEKAKRLFADIKRGQAITREQANAG